MDDNDASNTTPITSEFYNSNATLKYKQDSLFASEIKEHKIVNTKSCCIIM
ncbi:hypothetical protein BMW23_0760 [Bodo saltans virus]|jgi:hypothetical protein|uniref:Uncharacterized protein n=1 Tax=Bodo saltans virus TaxID=2024608 RepID=A0A2H4UVC3_9VIRU|nr:hypothetical protein QJ851_gp0743 [Bodo saltans virus]ATZ80806.1 hypothetical protein BMW23_0760 [Bodo saltans virus]